MRAIRNAFVGFAALGMLVIAAPAAFANQSLTELQSTGPIGGNGALGANFRGASTDGTKVFIQTNEPLVSLDTDASMDVYERANGTTALVSTGPIGGNGASKRPSSRRRKTARRSSSVRPRSSPPPTPTAPTTSISAPAERRRSCRPARAAATEASTSCSTGSAQTAR